MKRLMFYQNDSKIFFYTSFPGRVRLISWNREVDRQVRLKQYADNLGIILSSLLKTTQGTCKRSVSVPFQI